MIDMSRASVAIDLMGRDVTLRTYGPGAYVGGEFVPGPAALTTIKAVVQETDKGSLDKAGHVVEGDALIWTRSTLPLADEATMTPSAEIMDGAKLYRIASGKLREEGGFTRAVLERVIDSGRTVHA